jgi:arylsulfatase A-like enzyme
MKRYFQPLAIAAFIAGCSALLSSPAYAAGRRPNIIFIMADDLGYTDVACFGSKYYETPNIDRLATQGMMLRNYHQCQNCTPTRAALMKGSLYEGGTRDPFIVRWPGVTPPGSACDQPAIHVDLYPTLLEIAGAPKPRHLLDGESLVKLFRDPAAKLTRADIFQHFPGYLGAGANSWRTTPVSVIQSGDWKLMEFLEDGRLELYNLRNDIGETKNLAKELPGKTKELLARLVAWRAEVDAPMPTKNDGRTSPAAPKR